MAENPSTPIDADVAKRVSRIAARVRDAKASGKGIHFTPPEAEDLHMILNFMAMHISQTRGKQVRRG